MERGGSPTVDKIREMAGRVAASEGIEVVEVEMLGGGGSRRVRIFIDKPGGITHADCELVSRQMSAILDVEDLISGRYLLEVSSPGLDRKLYKLADCERFRGQKAKVRLHRRIDGQQNFTGRLQGVEEGMLALEIAPGNVLRFRWEDVSLARLAVEW
jgi:ribosome maturation factor RimP